MQIVIVSNIGNGVGLERDFCLLRDWLIARGHEAVGQQFDKPGSGAKYDLGIFLETINEHHIVLADRWWYFANPECLKPEFVRAIQRHCEKILVKTKDAERLMHEKFSGVHYVGFLTTDKRDAAVQREPRFLHVGGNSNHRNTNAVIAAWREYRYWNGLEASNAPLTVVSNSKIVDPCLNVPDITFIRRATDEQITELQNSHLFHILPSAYEGFGHALHESYSVGAILLTTGEPPMSELKAPFEIPSIRTKKFPRLIFVKLCPKCSICTRMRSLQCRRRLASDSSRAIRSLPSCSSRIYLPRRLSACQKAHHCGSESSGISCRHIPRRTIG
jgi:hypothetical protein